MPRMRSVLTRAGHPGPLSEVSPDVLSAVRAVYATALELARPRAISWEANKDLFTPELIPPGLEDSVSYTVLLATLGHELDEKIAERFAAGAPLEAVLFDAWGSEAAEALVRSLDGRLRKERAEALIGTIRFAPGYGGFPVQNNAKWLELLVAGGEPGELPITADSETGVLSPRKSILCMIGWNKV